MKLEKIRRIIERDTIRQRNVLEAKAYYRNETAIVDNGVKPTEEGADPLRSADNRIIHNYHEILVDEKASYMFTYPVLFDLGEEGINKKVKEVLGSDFERKSKNLCIEASNCGVAWLHYWIEEKEEKVFKYELVNTEEIIPIYDNGLERVLTSVIRYYVCMEEVEGQIDNQAFCYVEYWTDKELHRWKFEGRSCIAAPMESEHILHNLGDVPFIEFANNLKKQSDLDKYKSLIDLHDRVMSGFANDLEDVQQIIYILENYGGQDLNEFLGDLKRYKAIKTETGVGSNGGGLKTLQIDIPVEARKVVLEVLKKQIYESGQGLQQDVESVGNASGVALKFFYRKLELKSGLLETEFKTSFNKLIKAIARFLGAKEPQFIIQTFTRNMISNDLENAQIAKESLGIISRYSIIKNHPWVEDAEQELIRIQEENAQEFEYAKANLIEEGSNS